MQPSCTVCVCRGSALHQRKQRPCAYAAEVTGADFALRRLRGGSAEAEEGAARFAAPARADLAAPPLAAPLPAPSEAFSPRPTFRGCFSPEGVLLRPRGALCRTIGVSQADCVNISMSDRSNSSGCLAWGNCSHHQGSAHKHSHTQTDTCKALALNITERSHHRNTPPRSHAPARALARNTAHAHRQPRTQPHAQACFVYLTVEEPAHRHCK
jgi:hypothetical protein